MLAWLENGGKVGKRGAPDIPGAGDCPSLAAQFQTDFCQSFELSEGVKTAMCFSTWQFDKNAFVTGVTGWQSGKSVCISNFVLNPLGIKVMFRCFVNCFFLNGIIFKILDGMQYWHII